MQHLVFIKYYTCKLCDMVLERVASLAQVGSSLETVLIDIPCRQRASCTREWVVVVPRIGLR